MKTVFTQLASSIVAALAVSVNAQVEHPVKKGVGDTCSYQTVDGWTGIEEYRFTWTFIGVSDNGYEVTERIEKTGKTTTIKLTRDFNIVEVSGGAKYVPDSAYFSFPLEVGKSWESKQAVTTPVQYGTYLTKGKVAGEEKITTPAGTFSTVKIELKTDTDVTKDGSHVSWSEDRTNWYISELGCFAKRTYAVQNMSGRTTRRVSTELVGYTVGTVLASSVPDHSDVLLPTDISIEVPAAGLRKELSAFSGKWEGNWSGKLDSVLIIERIDNDTADLIYAWGNAPDWKIKKAYTRMNAKVTQDENSVLSFPNTDSRIHFTATMNQDFASIIIQRTTPNGSATETFKKVTP